MIRSFRLFRMGKNGLLLVMSVAAILLYGWGYTIQGQIEEPPKTAPAGAASKTIEDAPESPPIESEDLSGESEDPPEKPENQPQSSEDSQGQSQDPPQNSEDAQGESTDTPKDSADTPPSSIEDVLPQPSDAAEEWIAYYEELAAGIEEETCEQEDVDAFFQNLNDAIGEERNRLRETLATMPLFHFKWSDLLPKKDPDGQPSQEEATADLPAETDSGKLQTIEQLYADLNALYKLRIKMLILISPALRATVMGTGIEGVRAFKEEIDFLLLTFQVRLHLLPGIARQALDEIQTAPLPAFWMLLKVFVAFLIFHWWRRWAKNGIPKLRTGILGIKPQALTHRWMAKLLWYLNRVRSPVEWGLLLSTILDIISSSERLLIHSLIWTNIKLILIVWFVVKLVDALAVQGAAGLKSKTAKLRLRSVWLVAAWALVVGLGLGLTKNLAGTGTIYEWVWLFAKVLAIPVVFLLVLWWRKAIFRSLEEVTHQPPYVQKILGHQKGLISFFGAALGAVYLILNGVRQRVLRAVSVFEGGRYLIANLTRLEAIRVSERKPQTIQGDPVSDETYQLLVEATGDTVESFGQESLEQMVRMVDQRRNGTAVVVAERGGGRSHLFKRLAGRLEGKMLLFDCPPGGIVPFNMALAESLGLDAPDPTPEDISNVFEEKQIRAVGIDNLHRLSRPAFGGQQDVDRLASMVRAVQTPVFWFFGVDRAAWQYISRVRDTQLFLNEAIRMPRWTEDQIRELIEQQSAHAGITPDFSELVLPRQFEGDEFETMEDRNRFGFFRILWNASDGNPVVSLYLWADSLRVTPDGRTFVILPQLPVTSELETVHITVLLTLRVIAQSELANQAEIIGTLRLPAVEVAGALNLALTREWIESVDGRYRLTWKWFRSITRVLARQNLLVRRTSGA